jgi:membrane protein YdbS with pleckstrin-like domain
MLRKHAALLRTGAWVLSVMLVLLPARVALFVRRSTSCSPISRLMSSAALLALMRVMILVPVMPNQDWD